jgi:predicted CoA-binding protein
MNHDRYDDAYLKDILTSVRRIAVVGASNKPERPSYRVAQTLAAHGYEVIPVNPGLAGQTVDGRLVYGKLADIPGRIDMVDIFRNVAEVPGVVAETLTLKEKPVVIWMQLAIRDDAAAAKAEGAGIKVVMDRCPAIELPRLGL